MSAKLGLKKSKSTHRSPSKTSRVRSKTRVKKKRVHGVGVSSSSNLEESEMDSTLTESDNYKDLRFDKKHPLFFPPPTNLDDGSLSLSRTVLVKRFDKENLLPSAPPPSLDDGSLSLSRTVLVKLRQKSATKLRPQVRRPTQLLLAVRRREEKLSVYSHQTSLLERRCKALQQQLDDYGFLLKLREKSLTGQQKSLENWERDCQRSAQMRQSLSKALGVPPESVLINRPLPFPFVYKDHDHAADQLHRDPFRLMQSSRSSLLGSAFFLQPARIIPVEEEVESSFKQSEREFCKSPLIMVKPLLDGQPEFRDINGRTLQTDKELSLLYLRGEGIQHKQEAETAASRLCTRKSWSEGSPNRHHAKYPQHYACSPRLTSPYYVRNSVPAIQLDQYSFMWGQPCIHDIVEIGVVCYEGQGAWTSIRLANTGCCTIQYSWRHQPHVDHFNTRRYTVSPFSFDCSEGTILPEEKMSIPVRFLSCHPGSWTERWSLKTKPCLSPWGEILVNLWGHAFDNDANIAKRRGLERELEISSVQRMAERETWDLIKTMPIRSLENQMRDCIPPVPDSLGADDVVAFLNTNPGLHYHSIPMITLMKVKTILLGKESSSLLQMLDSGSSLKTDAFLEAEEEQRDSLIPFDDLKSSRKTSTFAESGSFTEAMNRRILFSQSSTRRNSRKRNLLRISVAMADSVNNAKLCSIESFKIPRGEVDVHKLYEEALNLNDDRFEKEKVLKNINQAIKVMSFKSTTPPMRHYKYIMVHGALSQLFDNISMAEWKLRENLGLASDPRFLSLITFFQSKLGKKGEGGKKISCRYPKISTGRKITSSDGRGGKNSVFECEEAINWEEWAPCQWRQKLRLIIYTNIASTLESLLPIMEFGGFILNPLLPKMAM